MGIVVIGDVFIDIKGFSTSTYIPYGRNLGTIEQIHGGVGRNVAEDIANVELEPIFIGAVDDDSIGEDVIQKLNRHKVDTRYMKKVKNGMGTWLAVFDHKGDVVASVSKRPDHKPMSEILDEHGDEIFKNADSIAIEIDMDQDVTKKTFAYAEKYNKKVYALVSKYEPAIELRGFIEKQDASCATSRRQEFCFLRIMKISPRKNCAQFCRIVSVLQRFRRWLLPWAKLELFMQHWKVTQGFTRH